MSAVTAGVSGRSCSDTRAHYAETPDTVLDDREEVVITRAGREPVVIVCLADYESLKQTAYLQQNPANARRLLSSTGRLGAGHGAEGELLRDIARGAAGDSPNIGIGKPEAFKHGLQGHWSRRITDERRLFCKVVGDQIRVAACRFHDSS